MDSINMKCSNPNHHGFQILFICLDEKCVDNRKCCVICVDQNHQKHEILSIDGFLKEINKNLQKNNNNPQKPEIIHLIKKTRTKFIQVLAERKSDVNNWFSKLEQTLNEKFNFIIELMSISQQQTIRNHILNTFHSTNLIINQYLNLSLKSSSIQIGTRKQMKTILDYCINTFQTKINQTFNEIEKMFSKIQQLTQSLQFYGKKYQSEFFFSEENKSLSIQLSDSKKTITKSTMSENYSICCLDKPLDPINNKFFVQINQNSSKKIWLGVCYIKLARRFKYASCFGYKKGTFAINQTPSVSYNNIQSNASSSSHEIQNQNFVNIGFNFKCGDIIYVQVIFQEQQIIFYVLNQNYDQNDQDSGDVFSHFHLMHITFNQGQIYPFVGLNGISSDQVTILNQQEIRKKFPHLWSQDQI